MLGLLLVSLVILLPAALGASQGLYLLAPTTGQLLLLNATSGERAPIGQGLASLGWSAPPDCSPTAIDTTGKWLYTFARRTGAPSTAPWSVLSLELRDGSIRKEYTLPPAFPPSLAACEHALAEDGGWHLFVTSVTRDAAPRLLVARFTYTWPFSNESAVLLDTPLAPLGMGGAPAVLTSAVTNFTSWVALEGGLLGLDLLSLLPARRLPLQRGETLAGLQYDISGLPRRTYGVLQDAAGATSIASFVDTGAGVPRLAAVRTAAPAPPSVANRAALMNDQGALAVASGGRVLTLRLSDGALLASVPECAGGTCPIALAYEPFVF